MSTIESTLTTSGAACADRVKRDDWLSRWTGPIAAGVLTLIIFYLSLIATSAPVTSRQQTAIDGAITQLEAKGFSREAFMLRHMVSFRSSDNWLNSVTEKESAYAATNFPFCIITLYPDFFDKATDDTERAMILLHEAQHVKGGSEHAAYAYVWRKRWQLGWTTLSHGTTPTFVAVEMQTRENAPELFTCADKVWSDCTESILAKR